MIAFFAFAAVASTTHPPLPPFRRLETVAIAKSQDSYAVAGDRIVIGQDGACEAYSLRTFKRAWATKLGADDWTEGYAVANGVVYACSGQGFRGTKSRLIALDLATGKLRWSVPREGRASAIAVGKDSLFLGLKPHELSAVRLSTHKPVWTTKFDRPAANQMSDGEVEAVTYDSGVVLANCNNTTYCVDATNGKILWKEPSSYLFDIRLVTGSGVAWVPSGNGAVARELRTGKRLWSTATGGYSEFGVVFAGSFVGLDSGQIAAFEPRTGKQRWAHTVGPQGTSGGHQYGSLLGERLYVLGISNAGIYDARGKELWRGPEDTAIATPIWSDGKSLVCFDGSTLTRYVHGSAPAVPESTAGRQALARKLVGQFSTLDASDRKLLQSLADDAFDAVLAAYLKASADYDAASAAKKDSYPLYSIAHDIGDMLVKVTTARRGGGLLAILEKLPEKSSAKPTLLTLLARYGDPNVVTRYFLKQLEGFETPSFEMYESVSYVARSYIANSDHPDAVKFMLRQLQNPKADETLRTEAYWNLARTGGPNGAAAVLAMRRKRELLPPLEARMDLDKAEAGRRDRGWTGLIQAKADASGRTWGLLESGILGSGGDLWVAEKVDGAWSKPLFTGLSTDGISRWTKPAPPEPKIGGKTAEELAKGAWFDVLLGRAELAVDSDGDGLTDIVEKRLGIDPKKADTDGDGDADGVDPWPNAAPRPLSDAEKVIAAVFEARYHFYGRTSPAVFFAPQGLAPFEMVGWSGPVIWQADGVEAFSTPLQQCYEQGVAFLRIGGGGEGKSWEEKAIRWNRDHTTAMVTISTYYGGLSGDGYTAYVKKFGSDWVVTSLTMAYVS